MTPSRPQIIWRLLTRQVLAAKRGLTRAFLNHCSANVERDIRETERHLNNAEEDMLQRDFWSKGLQAEVRALRGRLDALYEERAYLDYRQARLTELEAEDCCGCHA